MEAAHTMARASDEYGSFGAVPDVLPQGGFSPSMNIRPNPNAAGAQVGASIERIGNIAHDMVQKHVQIATEAKVNDDYANKYIPAANALRSKYDQLQGQDKVHGYESYINDLQNLNKQFSGQYNVIGQQMMSGQLNRYLTNEIASSQRELAESQKEFSNRAAVDKIKADSGFAAQNYNNPDVVNQVIKSNDSIITMQHIDNGFDPNNADHNSVIEESQRSAKGSLAVEMINSALSRGDASAANNIRQSFAQVIPGYQQLNIDNTLYAENMRQTSVNAVRALSTGLPLPQIIGAPPAHIQATIANAAQTEGIDPNHALTVAYIESNMGQNLGKRGDIGQTGKGGDIQEQASNMVSELKKSQEVANKALGREADPWEQYACYQQGEGGGPALLKASIDNPNAKAIEVLNPLYKNFKDAKSAILNNGGNLTMTSGDFLGLLHKKYEDNARRAACDIPKADIFPQETPEGVIVTDQSQPKSLSDAFIAPHNESGQTVQPAATPRQALNNYDEKFPDMMARANSIPNIETRAYVIKMLKSDRENLAAASAAYSSSLVNKAHTLANDPDFTSIDKIPSVISAALLTDHPDTLHYLELRAEYNLNKRSGSITPDMKTYGPAMFDLMRNIHSGKIRSADELMSHLPRGENPGDITLAGYDKLIKEFTKDPDSQSDSMMKTQAFKVIKRQLSGEDDYMKDPKGEALFSQALPKLFKAIENGRSKGLSMGELTDPSNANWIGNVVQGLKRSPAQMAMDIEGAMNDLSESSNESKKKRTFLDIYSEYKTETDPQKKAALKKEAKDLGLLPKSKDSSNSQAPISSE